MLNQQRASRPLATACAAILITSAPALAATVTWSGPGSNWNTTDLNWNAGSAAFADTDDAVFAGAAPTSITIDAGGVLPASTTFSAGSYTFTGGNIGSGSFIVNAGTQTFGASASMLGTTATVNAGGVLAWTGNTNNTRYGDAATLTLNSGRLAMANFASNLLTETVGNLNFSGDAEVIFTRNGTTANSNLVLQFNPNRVDRGVLVMGSNSATVGSAVNPRQWFTSTGTAPTITNGMAVPSFLMLDTTNDLASFATYANTGTVSGRPTTSFRNAASTEVTGILNVSGEAGSASTVGHVQNATNTSGTLGNGSLAVSGATKDLMALRLQRPISSDSGTTINIHSGGLILSPNTSVPANSNIVTSGIVFDFQNAEAVIYAGGGASATHTIGDNVTGTNAGLTKGGLATLVLSGATTYTGQTTVNQGTLRVNGSLAETDILIASGGRLEGTGTLNFSLSDTPQGITLRPGATLDISQLTLQFAGTASGSDYLLVDYSAAGIGAVVFATNLVTDDTFFAAMNVPAGYAFFNDASAGQIILQVPEPASLSMIAMAGGLLLGRRRR